MAGFDAMLGTVRADCLVASLLILQSRGRVTATQLADELEISERTARRDLEALSIAGVPVYSQPGRGGGWSLVGGATTDLTGLSATEARTLFLVAGPEAATPEVKSALRKLVRALPETFRADAEAAAAAVWVDHDGWDHAPADRPAQLGALQQAVVEGFQVQIHYARRDGAESKRTVHPLGLVIRRGVWYLVAGTDAGQRTFRVDRVRSVVMSDQRVRRPPEFDLGKTWRASMAGLDERRKPLKATVRTDAAMLPPLRWVLGPPVTVTATASGRFEVTLSGYSAEILAAQLAGFGDRVEVVAPAAVRDHLRRIGAELTHAYGDAATGAGSG